jgi:hypothetical protein
MSENKKDPNNLEPAHVDAQFAALTGALVLRDTKFAEATASVRPTIAQQRERFKVIRQSQYNEWQEAGILGVVADRLTDNLLGDVAVTLERVKKRNLDNSIVEEHFLAVRKNEETVSPDGTHRSVSTTVGFLPVSQAYEGARIAMPGFTDEQSDLVARQVDELAALREDAMQLPNLDWTLTGISDPSTLLRMRQEPPVS